MTIATKLSEALKLWPCGHERTDENTQSIGVAGVRCRICRLQINKRNRDRMMDTPEKAAKHRERMRLYFRDWRAARRVKRAEQLARDGAE